jgi:membrane-bound ClpP family serine protease
MNHAFESALGVLGTAVPLITFAFGLVFCMLNRSFMPMIGAVVLSTAAHVVFGVVIPEREPRVSLAEAVTEAVNSLKFDRTRGLFDDLRVPASQRDYTFWVK